MSVVVARLRSLCFWLVVFGFVLIVAGTNMLVGTAVSTEITESIVPKNKESAVAYEELLRRGIEELVFVKRKTFQSSHYYTDFIDGVDDYDASLCVLNLRNRTVRNITANLPPGAISRCNLSYDAKKVVFDYKASPEEGFRIWEVGIDGSGLRRLTFPPEDEAERIARYAQPELTRYLHQTDDMHPCYLPDGGVIFVSTRCEYGILCDGADILSTSVLYRIDADGENMEKLSNNALSEATPAIMEDGRVVYTRWEYIDNGSVSNKGLWIIRPDGTGSEELYGANISLPPVHYAGRAVPGSNHLFVCVGTPHMPLAVGTIVLIDSRKDRRTGDPMIYVTPEVEVRHQWGWDNCPDECDKPFDVPFTDSPLFHTDSGRDGAGGTDRGPLFADPYPLDEETFIASFNPAARWNKKDAYSLYLVDLAGHRLPLHREKGFSCWSPIPVRPVPVPPNVCGVVDTELKQRGLAQLMIIDVNQGLDGVAPGVAKYIRINEHVPRPWSARRFWLLPGQSNPDEFDQQHSVITMRTHLGLKTQHGIVPIEEDGSANFYVKSDKNIFFQLLDENFQEIQRERTFTNFRPGEMRTCIGCHERATDVPGTKAGIYPKAMQRSPDHPGPAPGEISGAKPLHYPVDVQPVLDRYCVDCHNEQNAADDLVLTGEPTELFSRSYEALIERNVFPIIGENHPKMGNNHYLPPYSLGSHASTLIARISDPESPCFVEMPLKDKIRITTWVDSNGQYYGTYFGKKSLQFSGSPDFRRPPTFEETQSTTAP